MHIVWIILIGFVIGLLARALKPGNDNLGLIMTTLLGIGGAVVAQYAGEQFGWYKQGEPASFIASIGGAIVLLLAYGIIKRALRLG